MKNSYVISGMARMLSMTSKNLEMMVNSTHEAEEQSPEISATYEDMILDELNHVQMMTLALTKMLTEQAQPESHGDGEGGEGSAFAAGELDDHATEPKKEAE